MHLERGRVAARNEVDDAGREPGVDRRLPVKIGDAGRALAVHLHLGRVIIDAAAGQKIGEIERAEQRGQAGLEHLFRVERVRHGVCYLAAERARTAGEAHDVQARRREAAGLSSAERRTQYRRGQVAGHVCVVRDDLGERAGLVSCGAETLGEVVRREPYRRDRGRSRQCLHCRQVDVGGEETRVEERIAARALVLEVNHLRNEARVVLARRRVAVRQSLCEGHLLTRDRCADPGPVGLDRGVDRGEVGLTVRHEDQRLLEINAAACDVLGVTVEEEVLLVDHDPERPVRHGRAPVVRLFLVRVLDVRGYQGGQPDAPQWHAASAVGQSLVWVEPLGFFHHDVHVLAQVRDGRTAR
ncbi:MAG: hypothetical protein M3Z75_06850 [Actinomycetota bacterium]|nr:hypothetical protein [Actinomycetota bacterium]